MADAQFKIEGLDPILAKMKNLSAKMQKGGVRRAGLKAMRIVRDDARSRAKQFDDPTTPNNIPKSIVVKNDARYGKRIGGVVIKVGVLGGAVSETFKRTTRTKNKSNDLGSTVWYWRLLEFGTSRMRAQPFMRPALANNVGKVTESMVSNLNTEIDKIIAKGG